MQYLLKRIVSPRSSTFLSLRGRSLPKNNSETHGFVDCAEHCCSDRGSYDVDVRLGLFACERLFPLPGLAILPQLGQQELAQAVPGLPGPPSRHHAAHAAAQEARRWRGLPTENTVQSVSCSRSFLKIRATKKSSTELVGRLYIVGGIHVWNAESLLSSACFDIASLYNNKTWFWGAFLEQSPSFEWRFLGWFRQLFVRIHSL